MRQLQGYTRMGPGATQFAARTGAATGGLAPLPSSRRHERTHNPRAPHTLPWWCHGPKNQRVIAAIRAACSV